MTVISPSAVHMFPRHRKWRPVPPPLNLASIAEERGLSDYDCSNLNLGVESPTASTSTESSPVARWAGALLAHIPRRSSRNSPPIFGVLGSSNKCTVDQDCGICFEFAVVPCRTLCCGKIFCTEHLSDWLHGPKAVGRCPNCEAACSLEGGTISLASPTLRPSSQGKRKTLTQAILTPPPTLDQPHSSDTLTNSQDEYPQVAAKVTSPENSSVSTASTCFSTVDCSEMTVSAEREKTGHHFHHTFQQEGPLPRSLFHAWGVVSRLISVVLFLMTLYKLRYEND